MYSKIERFLLFTSCNRFNVSRNNNNFEQFDNNLVKNYIHFNLRKKKIK